MTPSDQPAPFSPRASSPECLDFDLLVGVRDALGYPVNVIHSPAGEARSILRANFLHPQLRQLLDGLDGVRGTGLDRRATAAAVLQAAETTAVSERGLVRELGGALFEVLFSSEVLGCYRSSLAIARRQGRPLRLRLQLEAPELATLPWELLRDDTEGDHISLLSETPFSRYLPVAQPVEALSTGPPVRILGMVASPPDLPRLDVEEEQRRVCDAIDHLTATGAVELDWVEGQAWRDLERALQGEEWHVFHFIGHGDFDEREGEGRIALVDEEGQRAAFLWATQLGRLLGAHPSLRLAVLNACEGARASEQDLFTSTGAVLVRRGIPAVVSMQFSITDRAAIEFSRGFYDALARGVPVDFAMREARVAISMALGDSAEWGTPVLHMRALDGKLFELDLAEAIFRPSAKAEEEAPRAPEREAEPPPPAKPLPPTGATDDDRRGLEILRRKVGQYWIDGVLSRSIADASPLKLEMGRIQGAVDSPWLGGSGMRLLERPRTETEPLGPGTTIADVFDDEGGSLLLLGEPGCGKTTTMLELCRDLLSRVEGDPRRPVPAVFNLSGWIEPYTALDEWLVDDLSARYQIPKRIGRRWLGGSRLLVLLDGLDELTEDRRPACVDAINVFLRQAGPVGAVVCCRWREYVALPNRLSLNAAIRLLPLADRQVERYLEAGGEPLAGLRALLARDSALRIEARSPLMLSLMTRVYRDLPLDELPLAGAASTAARREELMSAYVEHMFRRAGEGRSR